MFGKSGDNGGRGAAAPPGTASGMGSYGNRRDTDPRVRAVAAAVGGAVGGAAVAGPGPTQGSAPWCPPRPPKKRGNYITLGALFETSTADVSVYTMPLYLTAIYIRVTPTFGVAPTLIRARVWDTSKPAVETLSVSNDRLVWETEQVSVGGVFYWEPPVMDIEEEDYGGYHRHVLLGPYYQFGLRIQLVDSGGADAILTNSTMRLNVSYIY